MTEPVDLAERRRARDLALVKNTAADRPKLVTDEILEFAEEAFDDAAEAHAENPMEYALEAALALAIVVYDLRAPASTSRPNKPDCPVCARWSAFVGPCKVCAEHSASRWYGIVQRAAEAAGIPADEHIDTRLVPKIKLLMRRPRREYAELIRDDGDETTVRAALAHFGAELRDGQVHDVSPGVSAVYVQRIRRLLTRLDLQAEADSVAEASAAPADGALALVPVEASDAMIATAETLGVSAEFATLLWRQMVDAALADQEGTA